jgi:hypothetical protein
MLIELTAYALLGLSDTCCSEGISIGSCPSKPPAGPVLVTAREATEYDDHPPEKEQPLLLLGKVPAGWRSGGHVASRQF